MEIIAVSKQQISAINHINYELKQIYRTQLLR